MTQLTKPSKIVSNQLKIMDTISVPSLKQLLARFLNCWGAIRLRCATYLIVIVVACLSAEEGCLEVEKVVSSMIG